METGRPVPSTAGRESATSAARTGPGGRDHSFALRSRLQRVAEDLDHLWRDAMASSDFDLITRAADASRGVHRALLALDHDRFVIGHVTDPAGGGRRGAARGAGS